MHASESPDWGTVITRTRGILAVKGYTPNFVVGALLSLAAPAIGGLLSGKKYAIVGAAIALTVAIWLLAIAMIRQLSPPSADAAASPPPTPSYVPLTPPAPNPTRTDPPPEPSVQPPQNVSVSGSSHTTVYQAGRDVLVQPVTIQRVDPNVFRPPTPEVQRALAASIQALRQRHPALAVQIDIETGSSLRFRVADTLGQQLERASIGGFGRTNTFMGVAPEHPVTVWCAPESLALARDVLTSVTAYLRVLPEAHIEVRDGSPSQRVHIFINGLPRFNDDGTVVIE